jgi:hypothetical protein
LWNKNSYYKQQKKNEEETKKDDSQTINQHVKKFTKIKEKLHQHYIKPWKINNKTEKNENHHIQKKYVPKNGKSRNGNGKKIRKIKLFAEKEKKPWNKK